ncbi:MAG TPA: NAD(P)H-hydrate dehydratase [Methylomirabilota bacterium]|nr:NAD(P)H-hydrate dehydratase [Methylomirabilota bacterium]
MPVISVEQMREWECATWATGQTEGEVITRVGEALAQRAMAMTQAGEMILLLAGKGHNGDDVRAMQPHLVHRDVRLVEVGEPAAATAELAAALQLRPALVVDGLFGIGLNRPLAGPWVELIERLNEARLRVLAVDIPSGLDAETGRPMPVSIRATVTMTVGAPKLGFFAEGAVEYVGKIEVLSDVGLIECPIQSDRQWTVPEDFTQFPPPRPPASHKGTFGHAAIVAGSVGYHGASVLAARGAQRARPGLVTLFPQQETYGPVASQLQAVMVHPWDGEADFSNFTAALFGPGLAAATLTESVRLSCQRLWMTASIPVVVDASALEWLPPGETIPFIRVMTPHPGEAARLLKCSTADVQRDRMNTLRALSKRYGNCWVVLKGQHTLVGRATGNMYVNSSGNAGLAQGGTGDLLAGFMVGWLAQPTLQSDPLQALRYAVWEHGRAADRLSGRRENWIVEELAEELGHAESSNADRV